MPNLSGTGLQSKRSRLIWQTGYMLAAVVLLSLGATAMAWGQCDPTSDCDSCATKAERMKCKFDAISNEGMLLLNQLQEPPFAELQTPASMAGLNRSKDRLEREKGRMQAQDFGLLTKKKETSCQIVEAMKDGDGNEDGMCDPGEQCAEAMGDGIGNDDGICWPMKGKKREVCAQICDEEATLQDENNIDDDLSAELEGVFEDMTGHAKKMNQSLREVASLVNAFDTYNLQADVCPLDTLGLSRTSTTLYQVARGAADGARGGADIAERLCDQQVMMNCAACCAPSEILAGALQAGWTAIEITESTINSSTIDAALSCVAKLKQSASDNNAQLLQVETELKDVEATQRLMIQMLNSPLGQRPNFPMTTAK